MKESEYIEEVVWNGSTQKEGSHTKGELLGNYPSKSTLTLPHPYVVSKIRGKIKETKKTNKTGDD